METSFFIIKPEAMKYQKQIKSIITSSGLSIVSTKTLILSSAVLKELYPTISIELWKATLTYLSHNESEMGIVEGENAIKRLLIIGGESTNPKLCNPNSIRGRFGEKEAVYIGGVIYYKNGFHRSHNKLEAIRDINLFYL